jgi:ADP-ribose pyrophosphatase YjhB (NUDIX family)
LFLYRYAMSDPDWLNWAREIQAIAQTGLAFSKDPYDLDRFAALRRLSARIMAEHAGADLGRIEGLFDAETGYATPKIGVRGAVFDASGRILMVRETVDDNRWTLPGGWADVNQTPAQSVVREVFEESGYDVRAVKLAAVWDRARQAQPATAFSVVRMFFICALEGGEPRTSLETSEVGWFAETDVPADLSLRRTLPHHISRMFAHRREPGLATEFD